MNLGRFYPPKFCRAPLVKLVYCVHIPWYEPHPMAKFHEVTPTTPKVIGAHMWNFKPNFKCSPLKFIGEPPY